MKAEEEENDPPKDQAAPKAKAMPRGKGKAKAKGKAKGEETSGAPHPPVDEVPLAKDVVAAIAVAEPLVEGDARSSNLSKMKSSINLGGTEAASTPTPEVGVANPEAPKASSKRKSQDKETLAAKEVADQEADQEAAPAKRLKGEVATFARRVQPTRPLAKMKWLALRSAFNQKIKPGLKHYSAEEACGGFVLPCQCLSLACRFHSFHGVKGPTPMAP